MNQCNRTGCPRMATHLLKMLIPVLDDEDDPPAELVWTTPKLCEEHAKEAEPRNFIDAGGNDLLRHTAHVAKPGVDLDFDGARFECIPIASEEAQRYLAATNKVN